GAQEKVGFDGCRKEKQKKHQDPTPGCDQETRGDVFGKGSRSRQRGAVQPQRVGGTGGRVSATTHHINKVSTVPDRLRCLHPTPQHPQLSGGQNFLSPQTTRTSLHDKAVCSESRVVVCGTASGTDQL